MFVKILIKMVYVDAKVVIALEGIAEHLESVEMASDVLSLY